ncbi:MAG TPA: peptide-methionine (R)-S-oxide reductase MsrB, partial [Candidatus Acidoferrales bacterium]|nr:peptide-methionine (R)-S-oxide reductase MsrB [Candidatus Acidoferrales bacterium]
AMFEWDGSEDRGPRLTGRRAFLIASGAALAGFVFWSYEKNGSTDVAAAPIGPPKFVTIVEFTDAGERKGEVSVPMIEKSDAEWRKQLSASSFEITRRAGTEFPGTGELLNVHDKGVFRCICCDTAVFSSATKFDSGTGWPSFWEPIAKENVVETTDTSFGMTRTAVSCRRCEAHLGHVFDDGPRPTGLRYCMNSVAMRFAKAS